MQSDARGARPIVADHNFPLTAQGPMVVIDSRDYYGSWKHSVAALECAIRGTSCEISKSAGGPEQVGMGLWSDGVPVAPLLWYSAPSAVLLPCEAAPRATQ
jgi:hypothetical protein